MQNAKEILLSKYIASYICPGGEAFFPLISFQLTIFSSRIKWLFETQPTQIYPWSKNCSTGSSNTTIKKRTLDIIITYSSNRSVWYCSSQLTPTVLVTTGDSNGQIWLEVHAILFFLLRVYNLCYQSKEITTINNRTVSEKERNYKTCSLLRDWHWLYTYIFDCTDIHSMSMSTNIQNDFQFLWPVFCKSELHNKTCNIQNTSDHERNNRVKYKFIIGLRPCDHKIL